jgi:putative ubiquitin-RnfH superfamily antitoxin RatB of RatAB toxin-antitoxin module
MAPAEAGAVAGGATIQVEVVFSPAPRQIESNTLSLPVGSTVKDALLAAGCLERVQGMSLGVWGRKTVLGHVLQDRDRVEAYRGLIVDPKEARRVRYRAHGEKLPKGITRPKARPATESSD